MAFAEESAAVYSNAYSELSNGQINYKGTLYDSFSSYIRSFQFQTDGRRCGIDTYTQNRTADFSTFSTNTARSVSDCTTTLTNIQSEYWPVKLVYEIPVWFHIITKSNGDGDISNERIHGQIAVLNEDFRATTGSLGANSVDVKVQFRLAGITRTQNDNWFTDSDVDEISFKAALNVDPSRYLNIYTNDARGYLGYATYPQNTAGSAIDGIVLLHQIVSGRDNGLDGASPYNQGRTAVHEVGHYLGLMHTFAAVGGYCGNSYSSGDLITDTSPESTPFFGCGTRTTCYSGPDPTDNYMNYSNDACMDKFTREQANRMVCSLVNYRPNLPTIIEQELSTINFLPPILQLLLLRDE